MKLSTRVRYGLRALIELAALQKDATPVLLDAIAQRQGISRKYLDSIFSGFKAAGLVRSARGAHGGFNLTRPAAEITVADVYRALEGNLNLVECTAAPETCAKFEDCPTTEYWSRLSHVMAQFLEKTTVQELADKIRKKREGKSGMYYI